ncbi:unnamed protein product [Urochloa humidicola]
MTVKVEQDPELELPPNAEDGAGAGVEELSPPLSSGEEEDDDDEEEDETDSEGYDGAGNGGGELPLKKGPWTPEEDRRLKDYVEAHGEGNWNKVQRNARLNRCGKSCRLRWANHLRPDLKKGPFDAKEVDQIIRFHIMWGNKWAKMASLLPGRTDNEIKNFWNTRLKRHQRAGLPIYPEYLLSRVPDQDMNCQSTDESRGKKRSNELPQEKVVDMDDLVGNIIVFRHLDYESLSSQTTGLLGGIVNKGDVLDDPTKSERFSEMMVTPLGYDLVSQSNAYSMRHPSSSVIGDCESEACPFTEIQASNSPSDGSEAMFTVGKSYPDASFPCAGMPGASQETGFLNDYSLLSNDQIYLYPSSSLLDEDSFEEHKPVIEAGQGLGSSNGMPGACNMPGFPGL